MKNRFFVSLAAAALCLSLLPATASAVPSSSFADVPSGAWYAEAVDYAVSCNIISGTSETTFSPQSTMTRGQFITILGRMAGASATDPSSSAPYSDVTPRHYFAPYVAWAWANGILGDENSLFRPGEDILREEMVLLLGRYLAYRGIEIADPGTGASPFRDDALLLPAVRTYGTSLHRMGILHGDDRGNLNPRNTLTRAEGVCVFMALHKSLGASPVLSAGPSPSFSANAIHLALELDYWDGDGDELSLGSLQLRDAAGRAVSLPSSLYTVSCSHPDLIRISPTGAVSFTAGALKQHVPLAAVITITSAEDGTFLTIPVTVTQRPYPQPDSTGYYLLNDDYKDAYAAAALQIVNQIRAEYNCQPMAYGGDVQQQIHLRSRELVGKFSHVRPGNKLYDSATTKAYTMENIVKVLIHYTREGSGVVYLSYSPSGLAATLVKYWEESAPHQKAMINAGNTRMCIGLHVEKSYAYSAQWFSTK